MFNPAAMNRIRKERKDSTGQPLSISKLAIGVGSDRALVSSWENGRREPTLDSVIKMADVLNCSVDDLVFRGEARRMEIQRRAAISNAFPYDPELAHRVGTANPDNLPVSLAEAAHAALPVAS